MLATKSNAGVERRILTGMIVSDAFLRQIQRVYQPDVLTPYARTVGQWCIDHYAKHAVAPRADIVALFDRAVRKGMDDAQMQLIETFLNSLSGAFTGTYNVEMNLADAVHYFQHQHLNDIIADVKAELDDNNVESALKLWKDYKPVALPQARGVNMLTDADLRFNMFNNVFEPMFELPGDLGAFINSQLIRKGFLAFQGADKRGKSWWLCYMALQAAIQQNNVAIFTLADLSMEEYKERFVLQQLHRPLFEQECVERKIPVMDCEHNQNGSCNMAIRECRSICVDGEGKMLEHIRDYSPCTACRTAYPGKFKPCVFHINAPAPEPVTLRESEVADKTLAQQMSGKSIKIVEAPSNALSPDAVSEYLTEWKENEAWLADVVIVDYADAMAPNSKWGDKRERVDSIWQGLNHIRQAWNLLLITATHTNRSGYKAEHLEMGMESESRTKNAHVTGMIGLNQNDDEQGLGVMRLNWINRRKGKYQTNKCVTVIQDLAGGFVCKDSFTGGM